MLILTSYLTSCSQNRSVVLKSDFCDLYEPLKTDLENDVVVYWKNTVMVIRDKEERGIPLTSNEKFVKITIENIGRNEAKFEAKHCYVD